MHGSRKLLLFLFLNLLLFRCDFLDVKFGPAASIKCVGWIRVCKDQGNCQGWWNLLCLFMPLLLFLFLNLLLFSCDYLDVKFGPATSIKCLGWIWVWTDQENWHRRWILLFLFLFLLMSLSCSVIVHRLPRFGQIGSSTKNELYRWNLRTSTSGSGVLQAVVDPTVPVPSSFIDYPDSVKYGRVQIMNCTGGIWGQVRADRGNCKRRWNLLGPRQTSH